MGGWAAKSRSLTSGMAFVAAGGTVSVGFASTAVRFSIELEILTRLEQVLDSEL